MGASPLPAAGPWGPALLVSLGEAPDPWESPEGQQGDRGGVCAPGRGASFPVFPPVGGVVEPQGPGSLRH